jgi:hypothetical protein
LRSYPNFTADGNLTPVQVNASLDNRQSQSRSRYRADIFRPIEKLKQSGLVFLRYANALVLNLENRFVILTR